LTVAPSGATPENTANIARQQQLFAASPRSKRGAAWNRKTPGLQRSKTLGISSRNGPWKGWE